MSLSPLLELEELSLDLPVAGGRRMVVDRVTLCIEAGERVGLAGESGSGKSLTALTAMGLAPRSARVRGMVRLAGVDLTTVGSDQLRSLRSSKVGLVFQEPAEALNPVYSVGFQLVETIRHQRRFDRAAARQHAVARLEELDLRPAAAILRAYPHQLSGGQLQRVMLALALAGDPALLIADEPTTALDVITQAEVLRLLATLSDTHGMALLLISHDLAVMASMVQRILVMYRGEIVEHAPTRELLASPLHPYTQSLLAASRAATAASAATAQDGHSDLEPNLLAPSCRFLARCPHRVQRCAEVHPGLVRVAEDRWVRCDVCAPESHRDQTDPQS